MTISREAKEAEEQERERELYYKATPDLPSRRKAVLCRLPLCFNRFSGNHALLLYARCLFPPTSTVQNEKRRPETESRVVKLWSW